MPKNDEISSQEFNRHDDNFYEEGKLEKSRVYPIAIYRSSVINMKKVQIIKLLKYK